MQDDCAHDAVRNDVEDIVPEVPSRYEAYERCEQDETKPDEQA